MNQVHIITVATHSQFYFPYLIESVERHGNQLTILGFNEEWKGFNWKFKKMLIYLQSLPPNDIACFLDGYDVVCLRDLDDFANKFIELKNKYKCKIIVAMDIHYPKYYQLLSSMYFSRCNNKYLNSGTYIGYVKDLIIMLNNILNINKNDDADDQQLLTNYCIIKNNDIYIDSNNEIFLTIVASLQDINKYVEINNNKLKYNNQYPYFIHAPGSGYLDNILLNLGYNLPESISDKVYNNFFKNKILLYIKLFFRDNYLYIIFIILIIIIIYKLKT